MILTCTVVVGIEHRKQRADSEDVVILVQIHLEMPRRLFGGSFLKEDLIDAKH